MANGDIGEIYARTAQENSLFPALLVQDRIISHGQFWLIAQAFAKRMQTYGVDRKSLVAISTSDVVVSLSLLVATALLGCRFVVASAALANAQRFRPTHFFRSSEMKAARTVPFVEIDASWAPQAQNVASGTSTNFPGFADSDDPWMILHTSGTTGTPKYLVLSHRVVLDRTRAVSDDFPFAATTLATLFGCTARPFYARALGALLNGCAIADGTDVEHWRQMGVNYVCGSPLQAAAHFRDLQSAAKFERIETSGGRLSDPDAACLLDNFQTVIDIYGATETNKSFANVVSRRDDGTILRTGKPLDSLVEITGVDGQNCAPGTLGTVRIRNPYLVDRYVGEPEKTATSFRDGWFYPGDLARWTDEGALEIVGREDDILSIGGVKTFATLIDFTVALVPGVSDAICAANPAGTATEALHLFVKFEQLVSRAECVELIAKTVFAKFRLVLPSENIYAVENIPRNEAGKPLRQVAQQRLAERLRARAVTSST